MYDPRSVNPKMKKEEDDDRPINVKNSNPYEMAQDE